MLVPRLGSAMVAAATGAGIVEMTRRASIPIAAAGRKGRREREPRR
jgi:hypothetical protein